MSSSKNRVAGIVFRMKGNTPLVAIHVPTKSKGIEDYSVTTITGEGEGFTDMAKVVCEDLCIGRAAIIDERSLGQKLIGTDGKTYRWYLMEIDPATQVGCNSDKISQMHWCCPHELSVMVEQMRPARRDMFTIALERAADIDPRLLVSYLALDQAQLPLVEERMHIRA